MTHFIIYCAILAFAATIGTDSLLLFTCSYLMKLVMSWPQTKMAKGSILGWEILCFFPFSLSVFSLFSSNYFLLT